MKLRYLVIVLALAASTALIAGLAGSAKAQVGPGPFDDIENHFKCYDVYAYEGFNQTIVALSDQFGQSQDRVIRPRYLCNPTKKNNTGIPEPDIHLVCYEILEAVVPPPHAVLVRNQFGEQILKVQKPELLCLPSKKTEL